MRFFAGTDDCIERTEETHEQQRNFPLLAARLLELVGAGHETGRGGCADAQHVGEYRLADLQCGRGPYYRLGQRRSGQGRRGEMGISHDWLQFLEKLYLKYHSVEMWQSATRLERRHKDDEPLNKPRVRQSSPHTRHRRQAPPRAVRGTSPAVSRTACETPARDAMRRKSRSSK